MIDIGTPGFGNSRRGTILANASTMIPSTL